MKERPRISIQEKKDGKWVPVAASKNPNIMSNRPRTEQKLTPPTAEEWRMRNREYRAKKQTELAEQIADRITPVNCETIMTVADKIKEIADHIGFWKRHDIQVPAMNIIELQNHIHELQTYLVRLEETAIGMHD
jgi:Mg2+ and Co2+ transporter CorA